MKLHSTYTTRAILYFRFVVLNTLKNLYGARVVCDYRREACRTYTRYDNIDMRVLHVDRNDVKSY